MPHPDFSKLIAALGEYDRVQGAHPDEDGNVAGVSRLALMGAAGYRARVMIESHGYLRKTLTPQQVEELAMFMASMWADGFTARATYDRMHGS